MPVQSRKAGSTRYYGWKPQAPDPRDRKFQPHPTLLTTLPQWYDLTAPLLPPPFNPCLDQGRQGSCGPNTAAECLMIDAERDEGDTGIALPSRAFIYRMTQTLMGTVGQDSGVDNRTMLKALNQYGWCDDALMPYNDQDVSTLPSVAAKTQAATRLITAYTAVTQDPAIMMACIASGLPFVFGFTVFTSFEGDGPAANGIIPMPQSTESVLGGHDVTMVGFNNTANDLPGVKSGNIWPSYTWKFRNHWYNAPGVPWGDGGYGYFPASYVNDPNLSSDFWVIQRSGLPGNVPTPPNPPQPPNPPSPSTTVAKLNFAKAVSKGQRIMFTAPRAWPAGTYTLNSK